MSTEKDIVFNYYCNNIFHTSPMHKIVLYSKSTDNLLNIFTRF